MRCVCYLVSDQKREIDSWLWCYFLSLLLVLLQLASCIID